MFDVQVWIESSAKLSESELKLAEQAQLTQPYLQTALLAVARTLYDANHTLPYYPNHPALLTTKTLQVGVMLADTTQARHLNQSARGKDYPTNVLSYPSDLPCNLVDIVDEVYLGELVLCPNVMAEQAHLQQKLLWHHGIHLFIHGVLHLFGFDHESSDADQTLMETLEINALKPMGIKNPYVI